jgi:mRNA interferase HigB
MHIISIKMLREFWLKHPEAEKVLREWHSVVEHAEFADFNHVREFFNSADYVPPYTVFDIGGNNYRLVVTEPPNCCPSPEIHVQENLFA